MSLIRPPWQFKNSSPTSVERQPPPDTAITAAQELAQSYRRVMARHYGHLLTMRLMDLIADYGLEPVQRELAQIEQNMALSVSTKGDPRR